MKKLLSLLAVSTLVGTSASNLKPMFAEKIVNTGFKSNSVNNKDISIQTENDTNPFISRIINIDTNERVTCSITQNGIIYVGTAFGNGSLSSSKLYKSINGINFIEIKSWSQDYGKNDTIESLTVDDSQSIYVGTYKGIFKQFLGSGNFFALIGIEGIVESLVIDSNNNIYAGTGYGLYKSTDGTEFIKVNVNEVKSSVHSLYVFNNILYIGNNDGLYKSNNVTDFEKLKGIPNQFFVYSISIASDGTVYAGTGYGLYKSTDGINFSNNDIRGKVKTLQIINISITDTGNIYIGTVQGLYKSNNGADFELIDIKTGTSNEIRSLAIINNTTYVGTYDKGLYAINLIERLIKISKPDTFDKSWLLYNGIVYNSVQKIDIKDELVETATLDNKNITLPATDLDITVGEHVLILTLKDKSLASDFGGYTNTGKVIYKLWVKTTIDKEKINYSTNIDDTDLLSGLVSDLGNTNNAQIIQTRVKQGSSVHPATLSSNFDDILIDYKNSFYIQGTVNETTNDFTESGSKQKLSKTTQITTDGIYHLHLVDTVGNTYDSYLELGESNWKLQGKFDDVSLNDKANKLNVTVDSHSASQEVKQEANGWLDNYKNITDSIFNSAVSAKGKGFNISIDNDLKGDYKSFLDPVIYTNTRTQYAINQSKLNNEITKIAEHKLQDGLSGLPQNLNVDTRNVINSSTLDSYKSWINDYQKFINDNKNNWITDIANVASRGFATSQQLQDIKNHIAVLDFKNYLQHVVWTSNSNVSTSNDYQQFVELDKLQSDTIDWVNKNIPEINQAYQNAIKDAESNLNLHGYSISEILNDKKLPKTKSEIDNFADGQSFHDWLQAKADNMYHIWQLKVGLPIGLILLGVTVFASLASYWKFSARHNPIKRAKKTFKPIPDKNIKKKSK